MKPRKADPPLLDGALFQQALFDFCPGGNLRSGIGSSETRLSEGDKGRMVEGITDQ